MIADKGKQFYREYHEALAAHLARKPRGSKTSRSARKLGKEAITLGLNAMDLARIHYLALQSLLPNDYASLTVSAATIFHIEALSPLEQERKTEKTKAAQTERALERQLQKEIKGNNKSLIESQRQHEQIRQLTYQFVLAQEKERKEISRDLHDEIAQVLAGINVRLAALKKIAQIGGKDIGERIDQTQQLVQQSVAAVHRYALRLRPSLLDDLGLVPSLRSHIKNLAGGEALNIRFKADSNVDFLSNEQRTALYRVAQESLANVVRHAKAKNVRVTLQKFSHRIRLEVHNDGKTFNAKRILNSVSHKRLGLLGMRERVEMLGGSFFIESSSANGTTVTAEIPLPTASTKNRQ